MDKIESVVTIFDKYQVTCDAQCNKAWGKTTRATDTSGWWLGDDELGVAPENPGSPINGESKPTVACHNIWCKKECERASVLTKNSTTVVRDLSERTPLVP